MSSTLDYIDKLTKNFVVNSINSSICISAFIIKQNFVILVFFQKKNANRIELDLHLLVLLRNLLILLLNEYNLSIPFIKLVIFWIFRHLFEFRLFYHVSKNNSLE